jgi:hypothetical protein
MCRVYLGTSIVEAMLGMCTASFLISTSSRSSIYCFGVEGDEFLIFEILLAIAGWEVGGAISPY